ncbi:MAG: hypothetical protein IKG42_06730 [Clostridia bacterium]|nr:hypothetical protein [Clostridia bacterium]
MLLFVARNSWDTTGILQMHFMISKLQEAEKFVGFMTLQIQAKCFLAQAKKMAAFGLQVVTLLSIVDTFLSRTSAITILLIPIMAMALAGLYFRNTVYLKIPNEMGLAYLQVPS